MVDRPEARNAFTMAMYFGIRYAANLVDRDDALAALVITGVGDVFIPGGDLRLPTTDAWTEFSLFTMEAMPFEVLRGMKKPVISAVNGICQGGGLLIAMLSDLAIVSDRATFRAPELARGISDMVYAAYLPAMVGVARARDLLLSGRTLTAPEAEQWGLITRVVTHNSLYEQTRRAVIELGSASPGARLDVRRALHDWLKPVEQGSQVRSLRGPDVVEGFEAFLEKRTPSWTIAADDVPLPGWAAQ